MLLTSLVLFQMVLLLKLKMAQSQSQIQYDVMKERSLNASFVSQYDGIDKFSCLARCNIASPCHAVTHVRSSVVSRKGVCRLFTTVKFAQLTTNILSTLYIKRSPVQLRARSISSRVNLSWSTPFDNSPSVNYTRFLVQYSLDNWINVITLPSILQLALVDYPFCADYRSETTSNTNECIESCILDKYCFSLTISYNSCYYKYANYTTCSSTSCSGGIECRNLIIPIGTNSYRNSYVFNQTITQQVSFRVKVFDSLKSTWSDFSNLAFLGGPA